MCTAYMIYMAALNGAAGAGLFEILRLVTQIEKKCFNVDTRENSSFKPDPRKM